MYTDKDIIEYVQNELGVKKTRKKEYIDPRNYLIAVLYEKFKYSDNEISQIFGIDRSTVNISRRLPYHIMVIQENEKYHENVHEVINLFPHILSPTTVSKDRNRIDTKVTIRGMDPDVFKEYQKRAKVLNIKVSTYMKWYLEESINVKLNLAKVNKD
jgi:hypothetical protein